MRPTTRTLLTRASRAVLVAGAIALLAGCAQKGEMSSRTGAETGSAGAVKEAAYPKDCLRLPGVYEGVIPAADGPGIRVTLYLRAVGTYTMTEHYIGRNFTASSGGDWSTHADRVALDPITEKNPARLLRIEAGALRFLDLEGEFIDGPLSEHYVLRKSGCPKPAS
ncbi:copper resistance protein NlpE [Sutterella megalosphaeroides]|uniref:Lipoprotein involved with copper homeostasis and adhesion n=1 Tax=Sutterella megalosphaeroides TaxID=2494234 RepID=A0A2Z6IA47_9BURK|nr:copper resistance protein NlpE [Sutterella megalosphaeroides]BBF23279.1 lipoprotein involved with copper homeostasis and adhesion [Sutterella megalosphaeroides]